MNAPRRDVTAGHRNHLPTSLLRMAARGLANGQWFSVGPETLNAVMARTGLPATERDQVAELSSQVDGWALRGKLTAPEAGVLRLRVQGEHGPAFTLDRRRGGEGWEYRLWSGGPPTESPFPPSPQVAPHPTSAPRWLRPERVVSGVERSAADDDDRPVVAPPVPEQPLQEAAGAAGSVEASVPATEEPPAEASATAPAPATDEAPAKPVCSQEGCGSIAQSRGMCNVHYNRDRRKRLATEKAARRPETPPSAASTPNARLCLEPDCGAPVKVKGRCHRCHQRQWWRQNAERINLRRSARKREQVLPARLEGDPALAADLAAAVREAEAKADALISAAEAKAAALVAEAQRKADELRATARRDAEGLRAQARLVAAPWTVVVRGPDQHITVVMRLDPDDAPVCRAGRDESGWAVSVWPPGRSPAPAPVQLRAQTMSAALQLADAASAGFGWRLLSSPRTGAVGPAEVQP
ncbi:MAG: hypothetical protein JNM72_12220 [Deltaproteobacteria bacterium]|nr:hypothetical protein [Deltaproteobacteria bacterium]